MQYAVMVLYNTCADSLTGTVMRLTFVHIALQLLRSSFYERLTEVICNAVQLLEISSRLFEENSVCGDGGGVRGSAMEQTCECGTCDSGLQSCAKV